MRNKFLINALLILSLLVSCNKDEEIVDGNETIKEEVVGATEISTIDKQLLTQIKKAGDLFDTKEVWNDYYFSTMPMYLLHKNQAGNVDRGIIINPQGNITDAIEITEENNQDLKVYRYDNDMNKAFELINSDMGNGLYDFNFIIEGKEYYIQIYTDKEVVAGENLQAYPGGFFDVTKVTFGTIDFLIHENFHTFQEQTFGVAKNKTNKKQAITLSKELLELRTLMHQIFKDFPNGNFNQSDLEEKLKQYVAIRTKQLEYTGTFYNDTENREGTARYVEKMALRTLFTERASESFIEGTVLEDDYGITTKQILQDVFNFQLSYEIGASACFALNNIKRSALDDINTGKTIYDVSKELFNMDNIELEKHLQNAKNSVDWNAIQKKVEDWQKLQ